MSLVGQAIFVLGLVVTLIELIGYIVTAVLLVTSVYAFWKTRELTRMAKT